MFGAPNSSAVGGGGGGGALGPTVAVALGVPRIRLHLEVVEAVALASSSRRLLRGLAKLQHQHQPHLVAKVKAVVLAQHRLLLVFRSQVLTLSPVAVLGTRAEEELLASSSSSLLQDLAKLPPRPLVGGSLLSRVAGE